MPDLTTRIAGTVGRRAPVTLLLVAALSACASPTSTTSPTAPPSSGSPTASSSPPPSSGPIVGAIEHPTGATDVILRLEHGGGLVPMEFSATQAPLFSLYGNGIMVFQPKATTFPQPDANGVTKGVAWRTAKLDEGQIQELLEFALGVGGLGGARDSYPATGVADAPDTIFSIDADGIAKRVVVNALGIDTQGGADAAARASFERLATRLGDIDRGGSIPSDVYVAERTRGVLLAHDATVGGGAPVTWPWPAIKPADFKPGAADGSGGPTLPHRTLTGDEVVALKLTGIEGGLQGLVLAGSDGKAYTFILRPLLVDERE